MITHLKRRLIPKMLIRYVSFGQIEKPVLVTTNQFQKSINVGDPVNQAKIYEAQMADELIVLNIDRTPLSGQSPLLALVKRLASETFMPLTIGGGVSTVDDFSRLLDNGADKVSINLCALTEPELIGKAAAKFGSQCVVVSIDAAWCTEKKDFFVHFPAGFESTSQTVLDWATSAVEHGAGELLITDVGLDGTGKGLNGMLGKSISESVPVPVILSGGCGLAEHFVQGFKQSSIDAIAAGTFFCFRDQNPIQLRAHIFNEGIPVRKEL